MKQARFICDPRLFPSFGKSTNDRRSVVLSAARYRTPLIVHVVMLFSLIYLSDVGIEVKAAPPNRSPSTATFPKFTVKSADPRLPAIAPNPGRSLNAMA